MIVGLAGHIDHGKSALVTALTGRVMDRLAEERRRGITIDLNFAPLDLGGGMVAGVVDVPGHEDFVRTMVAGASGVDVALLVIAADEGIMPQTLEHLTVLEHLRIPFVIPVLTKADLVERDWLDLVTTEVVHRLAASPLRTDPPIVTSARSGAGLDELRRRIADLAGQVPKPHELDVFRLPVDRAFSRAGVGTVVTGTAWSGRVGIGDEVTLLPAGVVGRVRSIEAHGQPLDRSEPGTRTAIGLAGVARDGIERGTVLVSNDAPWMPTNALDVEIRLEAGASRPLGHRTRVRFHLGTAEVMGRVLPRKPILPGELGLARLALESPVVARGGDRFVLRSYSPMTTIGGGTLLDPLPPAGRARWSEGLAAPAAADRLRAIVERRSGGLLDRELSLVLGLPPEAAHALAASLPELRLVGHRWMIGHDIDRLCAKGTDILQRYHRDHPMDRGLALETLRRLLVAPMPAVEAALSDMLAGGRIRRQDGVVALMEFEPRVTGGAAIVDELVSLLERAGLSPPTVSELVQQTGRRDAGGILRLAAAAGRVEAVDRERFYSRTALDRFLLILREEGSGTAIVPARLRERLGISRKYLIPLLEWSDTKGFTSWEGGVRKVRTSPRA
jgi:selenocysteine-specific elongation factor